MQSLVMAGAEFGDSEYDKQKEVSAEIKVKQIKTDEQKKYIEKLKKEYRTEQEKVIRNSLSPDERLNHVREWLQTEAGHGKDADYNPITGKFKNPANSIAFEFTYLTPKIIKPFSKKDFMEWVITVKKIDLNKLGL
jgi:hypothetical protein